MLGVAGLLAAGFRVSLAAWGSQKQIVRWDLLPLRLVQILADVLRFRVVGAMPLNRDGQ